MKKFTVIVCALAVSAAAFATPKASKLMEASKARTSRVDVASVEKFRAPMIMAEESRRAEIKTSDTIFIPAATPDAFHYGSGSNGPFYYTPALYIKPYSESLIFYNDNNFESTWLINDIEVGKDTAYVLPLKKGFGEYPIVPVMRTPKMIIGDTAEYVFPDYQYGAAEIAELQAKYPTEDLSDWKGVYNGDCHLHRFTQCAVLTENTGAWYFPFDYGTYAAGDGGDYWYGTKLVNNFLSTSEKTVYMDTTAVYFSNPGVMLIDNIQMGIYTRADSPSDMFPGENDHIRLTIYPVNEENGFPDWENPVASATSGLKDVVGSSWIGYINFNFLEEDPITHNFDTVPAVVEGDFYVVLDEYNDGTAAFGFLSDDEMTSNPNTLFFFYHPNYGRIVYTEKYRTPANLLINISGLMPTVLNAPEEVIFEPGAELTQVIELQTNTWGEDYDIDIEEDWLNIEAETVYEEGEDPDYPEHTFVVKLTISVEASEEVRESKVDINADGLEFSLLVKQNSAKPQGINNIKATNDNKMYNVLGVEVNEDYKGIVIRNGEKFVR